MNKQNKYKKWGVGGHEKRKVYSFTLNLTHTLPFTHFATCIYNEEVRNDKHTDSYKHF